VFGLRYEEVHKDACGDVMKVCDEFCGQMLYCTSVGYISALAPCKLLSVAWAICLTHLSIIKLFIINCFVGVRLVWSPA
jgi:hypothetical protein